jgi:chitodextrinase
MKLKNNKLTILGAISLILIFAGQGYAGTVMSNIVPDTELHADTLLADVGEDIIFSIEDLALNLYCAYINFHDGTPVIQLFNYSISHRFGVQGLYTITLTGVSTAGLTAISLLEIEIKNQVPEVEIVLPEVIFQDEMYSYQIKNVTEVDTANDIDSLDFKWNFGDGGQAEGSYVVHKYNNSGNYKITLFVIDDQGAVCSEEADVVVYNKLPYANFTVSNKTPEILEEITFDATESNDTEHDADYIQYIWDFGDGTLADGAYMTHTYTKAGLYQVKLSVYDNDYGKAEITDEIEVYSRALELETPSTYQDLVEGDTAVFTSNVTDEYSDLARLEYLWSDDGNGSINTQRFGDDGEFETSLIVQDPSGSSIQETFYTDVSNTNPVVQVDSVYLEGNIIVEAPGNLKHTGIAVRYTVNGEEQLTDIIIPNKFNYHWNYWSDWTQCTYKHTYELSYYDKWCGTDQYVKIPVAFNLADDVRFDIFYFNLNGTKPICETYEEYSTLISQFPKNDTLDFVKLGPGDDVWDVNLAKFTFEFTNGMDYSLHHIFRTFDNQTWNWTINPRDFMGISPWTIKGKVLDRGQDDLQLTVTHIRNWTEDQLELNKFSFSSEFVNQSNSIMGELPFSFTIVPKIGSYLVFEASDDDGGASETIVNINGKLKEEFQNSSYFWFQHIWEHRIFHFYDKCNFIKFIFSWFFRHIFETPYLEILSPKINDFFIPDKIYEESDVAMIGSAESRYSFGLVDTNATKNLTYTWNFGDGTSVTTNESTVYHNWQHPGEYLVQMNVNDSGLESLEYRLVNVLNAPLSPMMSIDPVNETYEDKLLNFTASVSGTNSELGSYKYLWDFGDGKFAFGPTAEHSWNQAGTYEVTLSIIDPEGFVETITESVYVYEFVPEIKGPYCFDGFEGNGIKLHVEYVDNIADYDQLHFLWNIGGKLYTESNPVFYGLPGHYSGSVLIYDDFGNQNSFEIVIDIHNFEPVILVNHSRIYGRLQSYELAAFALDFNLNENPLVYEWYIGGKKIGNGQMLEWTPPDGSEIYKGIVRVSDGFGIYESRQFFIQVIVDTDGDGISDELEEAYGYNGDNSDTDGDFLSDSYELEVSFTDPNNWDSDGDFLSDGSDSFGIGEFLYQTNPNNPDTDGDTLTDYEEIMGWLIKVNGEDKMVYSNPTALDSDGDGLTDTEEYEFRRDGLQIFDPMMQDTDGDGVSDLYDAHPELVDTDGDGLSDTTELEGVNIRLKDGRKYTVSSDPEKIDTDGDGLTDYEEYYAGHDKAITDPTLGDTDNDGLNDTEEFYQKKYEYSKRSEIPQNQEKSFSIGKVNFGFSFLELSIQIAASIKDIDGEDITADYDVDLYVSGKLITLDETDIDGIKYYNKIFNLTGKISPSSAKGTWTVKISCTQTAILDNILISGFMPLDPLDSDYDNDNIKDGVEVSAENGYITDPTKKDTDNDGWSDYYEIYSASKKTNPLSADTDGDGVIDSKDRDPLQDLYIQVQIKYAHWENALRSLGHIGGQPLLQVVASVNGRSVATPAQSTNSYYKSEAVTFQLYQIVDFNQWWNPFDDEWAWVTHTLYTWNVNRRTTYYNEYYTFDVDDSHASQSIRIELWNVWAFNLGTKKLSQSTNLAIGGSGSKTLTSGSNKVGISYTTKGMKRFNTVAVYNDTQFEQSHYNEKKNFNVFAVESATDYGDFDILAGLNYIVIPTELFGETLLNNLIQKATTDGEVDMDQFGKYKNLMEKFDFVGLDRTESSISPNLDAYYSTDSLLYYADFELLFEILTHSYNLSIGEIYQMTGQTDAEKLCLPDDVLDIIAVDGSTFRTDERGNPNTPLPTTLFGAIVDLWNAVINFVILVIEVLADLIVYIVKKGLELIGKIIDTAIKLIEAALKAMILVIAYTLFAIDLVASLVLFTILGITLFTLSLITNSPFEISILNPFVINTVIQGFAVEFYIEYTFKRYEVLDLVLPMKTELISVGDFLISNSTSAFFFGLDELSEGTAFEESTDGPSGASTGDSAGDFSGTDIFSQPKSSISIFDSIFPTEPTSAQDTPNLWNIYDPSIIANPEFPRTTYLEWDRIHDADFLKIYQSNESIDSVDDLNSANTELIQDTLWNKATRQDNVEIPDFANRYYFVVVGYNATENFYNISNCQSIKLTPFLTGPDIKMVSSLGGPIEISVVGRNSFADIPGLEIEAKVFDHRGKLVSDEPVILEATDEDPVMSFNIEWRNYTATVDHDISGYINASFIVSYNGKVISTMYSVNDPFTSYKPVLNLNAGDAASIITLMVALHVVIPSVCLMVWAHDTVHVAWRIVALIIGLASLGLSIYSAIEPLATNVDEDGDLNWDDENFIFKGLSTNDGVDRFTTYISLMVFHVINILMTVLTLTRRLKHFKDLIDDPDEGGVKAVVKTIKQLLKSNLIKLLVASTPILAFWLDGIWELVFTFLGILSGTILALTATYMTTASILGGVGYVKPESKTCKFYDTNKSFRAYLWTSLILSAGSLVVLGTGLGIFLSKSGI